MTQRAYTVAEIDALRRVVETMYLYGSYSGPRNIPGGAVSRSFYETEKVAVVEERVRTHMLAGHTAGDLLASEQK